MEGAERRPARRRSGVRAHRPGVRARPCGQRGHGGRTPSTAPGRGGPHPGVGAVPTPDRAPSAPPRLPHPRGPVLRRGPAVRLPADVRQRRRHHRALQRRRLPEPPPDPHGGGADDRLSDPRPGTGRTRVVRARRRLCRLLLRHARLRRGRCADALVASGRGRTAPSRRRVGRCPRAHQDRTGPARRGHPPRHRHGGAGRLRPVPARRPARRSDGRYQRQRAPGDGRSASTSRRAPGP